MAQDWVRLGEALATARDQAGLTQEEAARRLGAGRSTVQAMEGGTPRKKVSPLLRAYARLVGWTDDSPELVLAGGEPEHGDAHDEEQSAPPAVKRAPRPYLVAPSDLSLRVQEAIRDGVLVDSQVIDVPVEGGTLTATVVVRGEPTMSAEELGRALDAWKAREARLHEPAPDGDG